MPQDPAEHWADAVLYLSVALVVTAIVVCLTIYNIHTYVPK